MVIAETERLRLRHFHIVDGDAMDRVFGDPEVMQYGSGIQTPEWVRKWLRGCLEDYHQKWGVGLWAVVERETNQTIGFCGLSHFPDVAGRAETELGYRLTRSRWGRGYATEAAAAVRDYSFGALGLSRLISIIDPRNLASVRVAEKTGLRFEKDAVFHEINVKIYSVGRTAGG
jgi:RimJ/RimL family protein N-acetyltransferase